MQGVPSQPTSRYVRGLKYRNAPIQEAVLQIIFDEPAEWNVATPGMIYEKIRSEYPEPPQQQTNFAAQIAQDPSTGSPGFSFEPGASRILYRNATGTGFVVAAPRLLAVGMTGAYPGWEALRAAGEWVFDKLKGDVANTDNVQTVSLRYVNKIVLPVFQVNTDDYFNIPIKTALKGMAPFRSMLQRVDSAIDEETSLQSTFASLGIDPAGLSFLLDLEVSHSPMSYLDIEDALKIADALKTIENEEFESSITDETRRVFE